MSTALEQVRKALTQHPIPTKRFHDPIVAALATMCEELAELVDELDTGGVVQRRIADAERAELMAYRAMYQKPRKEDFVLVGEKR